MAITTEPARLLHLMAVMSPAFPVGGFAYSHGLEWAIDEGDVSSADDLRQWIGSLITHGSGWNDAVAFSVAFDGNDDVRREIDELMLAFAASRERFLETTDLGQSCAKAVATLTARPVMTYQSYPVVVAASCAAAGIAKHDGLLAFMQAFSNNLIGVGVRLVPLGQTKGLEIMRDLIPCVVQAAERAMTATVKDLGSSTLLSDIAAMRHETQHSRVFRS
jgi:urease accessory protein